METFVRRVREKKVGEWESVLFVQKVAVMAA